MILKCTQVAAMALFLSLAGNLSAQDPVATVIEGCTTEIEQYCSQVSPGEGRMLACFYAHEEKLSSQCQYSLYEAAAQLEAAVNALNYVATECRDDILAHCAEVELGEGRVLECLNTNSANVSAGCNQAIKDVTE